MAAGERTLQEKFIVASQIPQATRSETSPASVKYMGFARSAHFRVGKS